VRSKVEHMFGIMKGIFGFRKVRYCGLKKNLAKLQMIFASACSSEIRVGGMS
jgi:IS5 family transposase